MSIKIGIVPEKLLVRMWETLADKGIGRLLEPWHAKKRGIAYAEARRNDLLMLAQAEVDAEAIRNGTKRLRDYGTGKLVLASVPGRASSGMAGAIPATDADSVGELAVAGMASEVIRKDVNVARAILEAEKALLEHDVNPTEKSIDNDWLHRWRDQAGDVSSDELRQLWGRLLAGEFISPGRYSLRTLDFIRNLSSDEAREIARIAPYVVHNLIWRSDRELEFGDITYRRLLRMQELGILQGVEAVGLTMWYDSSDSEKYLRALLAHGKVIIIRADSPKARLEIPACTLTTIGTQVLSLGHFAPDMRYLVALCKYIEKLGFAVSVADVVATSDSDVRYEREVAIDALAATLS